MGLHLANAVLHITLTNQLRMTPSTFLTYLNQIGMQHRINSGHTCWGIWKTIVTTTYASQLWSSIPVPPTTYKRWTKKLPPAEHCLLYFVTYLKFNAEMIIWQHMLNPKSTSAISAIDAIRDCIPTQYYPDHAEIISTLQDVKNVIFQSSCQHVKSHQNAKKDFSDLPFSAQVNVLCDHMATRHMIVHRTIPANEINRPPSMPTHITHHQWAAISIQLGWKY